MGLARKTLAIIILLLLLSVLLWILIFLAKWWHCCSGAEMSPKLTVAVRFFVIKNSVHLHSSSVLLHLYFIPSDDISTVYVTLRLSCMFSYARAMSWCGLHSFTVQYEQAIDGWASWLEHRLALMKHFVKIIWTFLAVLFFTWLWLSDVKWYSERKVCVRLLG